MSTPQDFARKPRPEFRNIHISQIVAYRLPLAGIVSILHRISGALLFLALPLLLWLFELSIMSEISFDKFTALAASLPAKIVLLGLIWGFLHHLVAGLRFLVLDLHIGVEKTAAASSARVVLGVSLALTALAAIKLFGVF
ncbi:MAG: succinate dehydrogenase, cytochrome b556 subunit [Burkholderiaceae bacterium]